KSSRLNPRHAGSLFLAGAEAASVSWPARLNAAAAMPVFLRKVLRSIVDWSGERINEYTHSPDVSIQVFYERQLSFYFTFTGSSSSKKMSSFGTSNRSPFTRRLLSSSNCTVPNENQLSMSLLLQLISHTS